MVSDPRMVRWGREALAGPLLTEWCVYADKLPLYFADEKCLSQVREYLSRGMLIGQRA